MQQTTPVPNILFDIFLRELQGTELKVLLIIIRQTLGWRGAVGSRGRKELDWISSGQLQKKTGCSRRAISAAIESLVCKELILVYDTIGNLLDDPLKRQGKPKLYYRPSHLLCPPVEKKWISGGYPNESETTSAIIAEHLSKKVTRLAQKMQITK